MSKLRKCIVCADTYEFCPHCATYQGQPSWRILYCGDNCHDISIILNKHGFNHLTDAEAKDALQALDLSKIDSFTEAFKEPVQKLIKSRKKKKKIEEPVVEEITETESSLEYIKEDE